MIQPRLLVISTVFLLSSLSTFASWSIEVEAICSGTNIIYTANAERVTLDNLVIKLKKLAEAAPDTTNALPLVVNLKESVNPKALVPLFKAIKETGWRKGEIRISGDDTNRLSYLRIPFDIQQVQAETLDIRDDPFAAFRDFESTQTNRTPNKTVEPTRAPPGARGSP